VDILWILLPGPFVGYLLIDSVRKIFSEDERALRRVFAAQPVTMLAAATALGSVVVWAVSEVVLRIL
jgi:hypothetical protein